LVGFGHEADAPAAKSGACSAKSRAIDHLAGGLNEAAEIEPAQMSRSMSMHCVLVTRCHQGMN
jgi:hypothetical protein